MRNDDINMEYVIEIRDVSVIDEVSVFFEENLKFKKKSKIKVFMIYVFICNVKSLIDWLNLSVFRIIINILLYFLEEEEEEEKR